MAPRVQLAAAPVRRGKHLWTWDGTLLSFCGLGHFPVRMVIAGYPLPHGKLGLVVLCPLDPTPGVVEWLQQTGDVNFVVAPNKQHYWWAGAMKAAFPGSLLVSPLSLYLAHMGQLPVDVKVTPLAGHQDLPGAWPLDTLDMLTVQGLPLLDELVFLHKPSSTLILTDLAFNFQPEQQQQQGAVLGDAAAQPKQQQQQQDAAPVNAAAEPKQQHGPERQQQGQLAVSWPVQLYLRFAGGERRCCLTKPFRLLIRDAGALKDSLDQVLSWEFEQVSMAHGHFISSGGKQAFTDGTAAFVNDIVRGKQAAAAAAGGPSLAGTGTAVLVAAAVISTAVGIGVAGILQARAGQ